ncbi:MAG: hypothetical protein O7D91_04640 [Planctomycetota bacterium]|nr:hypothetical protein [Planctomycetota bacterium]
MIRKTLTIFSLIGLLLSAGALYVSRKPIFRIHETGQRTVFFALHKGGGLVMVVERQPQRQARWCGNGPGGPIDRLSVLLSEKRRWPHFEKYDYSYSQMTTLTFPLWSLGVLFALLLLPCFYTIPFYRRRKRKKLGLCLKCGYDLRASKDRCPECGEEFGSTNVE